MTVTERFLKYVTFETTSDESSDTVPSTATQLVLADYLVEELRGAGAPMQCATKWAMSMGISLRPMAAKIARR